MLILLFVAGNLPLIAKAELAQIVPDTTLGAESSTIIPDVNLQGQPTDLIEGGALRESNLFHSFLEFNIGEGEHVYFASPLTVDQIFSRVTGTHSSNILGTLGVNGTADLYLLNPHGVIFGPNASLDIEGSFTVSTADSIVFSDGSRFSAIAPSDSSILTVNVPLGLQLGPEPITGSAITNQGTLAAGRDFTLSADTLILQGQLAAGGNLTLQGTDSVQIRDAATAPFITAAVGNLLVQGNETIDIFALNHPDSGLYAGGNLILRSTNPVGGDAHYYSGGDYRIEQLDNTLGSLYSPHDPIIRSQGDVSFFAYQGASLHILAGGAVDIGTAIIVDPDPTGTAISPDTTPTLADVTLSDSTALTIDGSIVPTLDIRAGVDPAVMGAPLGTVGGGSGTFFNGLIVPIVPPGNSPTASSADITIGDVFIPGPTGLLLLTNTYSPNTNLTDGEITITNEGFFGDGISAAEVLLDSRGGITLESPIETWADFNNAGIFLGDAGDVTLLATENITFEPGSFVSAWGLLGGNITVETDSDIVIQGSGQGGGINSVSFSDNPDITGGDLNIRANALYLSRGSEIGAFTRANATAGNVSIKTDEIISLEGFNSDSLASVIRNQSLPGAAGDAGNLDIATGTLRLLNGAQISAGTLGNGQGGELTIAADLIDVIAAGLNPAGDEIPSSLSSAVFQGANGDSGNLRLITDRLRLVDGGAVTVSTFGTGNAGDLAVQAQSIEISGTGLEEPSGLFATITRNANGDGGNITVETEKLRLSAGGQISSSTAGVGNSGDVTVNATEIDLTGNSSDNVWTSGLFATVTETGVGQGGELTIETESLRIRDGAVASATTSGNGDGGDLAVRARSVELIGHRISNDRAPSGLLTQVNPTADGDGGDLLLEIGSLQVTDGAQISASTFGQGDAGDLVITADSIDVAGRGGVPSGLFSQVNPNAVGAGGSLIIDTNRISVAEGGQVSASTFGNGEAGSIMVTANVLEAAQGGQLRTTTSGNNDAGDIILTVQDRISLTDPETAILADTILGSTGNGGDIIIDPQLVVLRNGATIAVDSQGSGIGGDIDLTAETLRLENGSISAETRSNTGGNIRLNLQDILLLRDRSLISTTAGDQQFGGDGGNIVILAPFIIAVPEENSDITANAFAGRGGRVDITSSGIFGLQFQERFTPRSDITASSELGIAGEVVLNSPDTAYLANSLSELPDSLINTENLVAASCVVRDRTGSGNFTITGSDGISSQPGETVMPEYPMGQIRGLRTDNSAGWDESQPIVEPQLVYQLADGRLVLSRECP